MKAIVYHEYGAPDVLKMENVLIYGASGSVGTLRYNLRDILAQT